MFVDIGKARIKFALTILKGEPITFAKDTWKCYHLLQIKELKIYQSNPKK